MGKKNKEPVVDIICILDRSGSMMGLQDEVINSFNEFIQDQRKEAGKARVTLVLFDDKYEVVYEGMKLKKVPELTSETYFARGMTSLYDAIGKTLTNVDVKDAMVLIQTDGHENSSQEFNQSRIKSLIKEKEDLGWDFIFLGANIDAASVGSSFGLHASKTSQFDASDAGIKTAYATMNATASVYRKSKLDDFQEKNKGKGEIDD